MFSVGQTVFHKTRKLSGRVQECDGRTVYLVQENGVEIDVPMCDLSAEPPVDKAAVAVEAARMSRLLSARDITQEHRRVLSIIPPRTLQAVAGLYERGGKAARFNTLDVAQRLNYIAEVTAVPYRTMKQYSDRPGELGLMMAKGLAGSIEAAP